MATCWQPDPAKVRLAVIPNTLEVSELWVSQSLADEARKNPHLQVAGPAASLPFHSNGNLNQERLFPHSLRGRRGVQPHH
jgi:hypothetical protein